MTPPLSDLVRPEGGQYRAGLDRLVSSGPTSGWDNHATSPMAPVSRGWEKHGGQERNLEEISAGQRMISATWGSILTSLLATPLDVVRVRLQSQTTSVTNASPFISHTTSTFRQLSPDIGVTACCREVFWVANNAEMCIIGNGPAGISRSDAVDCAVETRQRAFTSTLDAMRKIARNEGPLALWRGLSPTLLMAIPANVIYFTGYDWLRSDSRSPIRRFAGDSYAPLVAGSVARIAAASVISPIEMFRTRLQATVVTGADHFQATLQGLHRMTQAKGYGSLWRGLTLTMWRDVPFSGLYWWGYESIRNILTDLREKKHDVQDLPRTDQYRSRRASRSHQNSYSTFVDSFIAGSVSGAIAAFVTTPFDVGKTRQQVFRHMGDDVLVTTRDSIPDSGTKKFAQSVLHPEQQSMPRFLYHIFREEGMSGLFKGWVARCLKVAPACAIMISSYEIGKKMARDVNERRKSTSEAEGDAV